MEHLVTTSATQANQSHAPHCLVVTDGIWIKSAFASEICQLVVEKKNVCMYMHMDI